MDNLLRLSFDAHAEYLTYLEANRRMFEHIWLWHQTLGNRAGSIETAGICDICLSQSTYKTATRATPAQQFEFQGGWWIGTACGCGVNALDRAVYRVFLDGGGSRDHQVYHVGQFSPFKDWLAAMLPNITTSQFEAGRRPGEIENDVRYEDLTRLSFDDGQFDCVIACEILEHVPDHNAALREMARILRPGGRALMTFPWLGGVYYDHQVRAELMPDGTISHILPPEYHGDPASADGILSFRAFGWEILNELRRAGFSKASAKFLFGPIHGHMTLQHPVIVGTR
jgi:SAM-dependent methyltransferase